MSIEISQNSQESTCSRKIETLAQVVSCEFCEISKNTSFAEHLRATDLRDRNFSVSSIIDVWQCYKYTSLSKTDPHMHLARGTLNNRGFFWAVSKNVLENTPSWVLYWKSYGPAMNFSVVAFWEFYKFFQNRDLLWIICDWII